MVVVSKDLSRNHPDVVREVHRLLGESAAAASGAPRFTTEEMRRSLQTITRYVAQQRLIPREFSVDELFDDVTRTLI
jgi:4,5-dihydroxyphthalate decarboxylase